MPLFSRRKREALGTRGDVYSYDSIPNKVRVQIVHIIKRHLGAYNRYSDNPEWWQLLVDTMREEKGVFQLCKTRDYVDTEFCNWLLVEDDIDDLIDGIELAFQAIVAYESRRGQNDCVAQQTLNARLREAGVGYAYEANQIIRVDQQVLHGQVVVPALNLLSDGRFASANREYLAAHKAFRDGDYETCLTECAKSFESVLKIIGSGQGWPIKQSDTASKLLDAAVSSNFFPPFMLAQFTSLRSMLESGVPTVRNKMSAHGAGADTRKVEDHLAAYQLHQTAAAIVFLVEQSMLSK